MAEVEFAGLKFTGGRMVALIVSLSTLGGGAYGVFEAYKQFTDMQTAISEYVSPDLSHIDNHMTLVSGELGVIEAEFVALKEADTLMNELVREQVNSIKSTVAELQTQIHDLKIEQKVDLSDMSARLDKDIEKQSNKLTTNIEQVNKDLNKVIKSTDDQEIRNRSSIRDTDLLLRGNVKTIRDIISSFEIRMDAKLTKLDEKIDTLEENLDEKIQRALINPLLGG